MEVIETKWLIIAATVMFALLIVGMEVDKYQANQCRIASAQAGKSADDIVKICK